RQLDLAGDASHALFDAVKPLFEEFNRPLVYGDAHTWFTRADDWESLNTSTPDAACGHNIDIWMPQGAGEREWRKLQNEIQMQWHAHPVNETREARGLKPVNSVWLWGGTPPAIAGGPTRYPGLERLDGWRDALGRHAARQTVETTPSSIIASPSAQGLAIETSLIEPALGGDWAIWLQRLHGLETDWFAPLLQALKAGKIDTLSLILTHGTQLSEFVSSKRSVGKFWVKPSLGKLVR
ncbi:MAG: hypothetical protein JWQ23_1793, partial [Herminiimonas sp.]|nr:hypothetical protein [Herminiimonas sp.]